MSHEILSQDLARLAAEQPGSPGLDPSDAAALAANLSCASSELPPGAWDELEAKLCVEDEAPRVTLSCTYCHDGLARSGGEAAAYCATCLAPHHADCFEEHARCAAPGCDEKRWVLPSDPSARILVRPRTSLGAHEPGAVWRGSRRWRRRVAWSAAAAAVFLGLPLAGILGMRSYVQNLGHTSVVGSKAVVLTFVDDFPAGHKLSADDVVQKEIDRRVYALYERENSLVTESKLSLYLGRGLDQRVRAGAVIRTDQFPAGTVRGVTIWSFVADISSGTPITPVHVRPRWIPSGRVEAGWIRGALGSEFFGRPIRCDVKSGDVLRESDLEFASGTQAPKRQLFEALVFKHDLPPGTRLEGKHLERRQIHWRDHWGAEGEGLIHKEAIRQRLGEVLARGAQGGMPVREPHFRDFTLANRWESGVPIGRELSEAEFVLSLSLTARGKSLLRIARPVDRARAYLLGNGIAKDADLYQCEVAAYCPPQPTVYAWLVTFKDEQGRALYVAVSEAGRTWQLNSSFEVIRGEEFLDERSLPKGYTLIDPEAIEEGAETPDSGRD